MSAFIDLGARDYEVISDHLGYQWRLKRSLMGPQLSRVLNMASSYLKVLWDE